MDTNYLPGDLINFYRGPESSYSYLQPEPTEKHKGGIFFAEDTHKLYLDGHEYGGDGKRRVLDVQLDEEKNLIIYYDDETTSSIPMKVTTSSVLTEEIEISGGPWASVVSSAFGNKIPANITFQSFLEKLLRKEFWPSPSYTTGSFSVSAEAPSMNITGASNGGTVLVGTKINVGKITAQSVTYSSTPSKITGITYGYSSELDGEVNTNTSITASGWTILQKSNSKYSLTRSASGFGGEGDASTSAEIASDCILNATTLTVGIGSNSISITQTSPTMTGSAGGIGSTYYYLSSFGNRDDSHKTRTIAAQSGITKTPSNTSSSVFSVTGVRPCYTNISGSSLLEETSVQLPLTSGSTFTISFNESANNKHFMFEYPTTHTVSSFKVKDLQGNYVDYKGSYNKLYTTTTRTINGVEYQYNIFSTEGPFQGSMDCKISLNKGLNS